MIPLLALLASFALAQEPAGEPPPLVGVVTPGSASFPIALPLPADINADDAVVQEVWDVVHKDLITTGYFNLLPLEGYVEKDGGIEPGTFQMSDWTLLKATAVAKMRVIGGADFLQADVFVYDVNGNALLAKKGFRVKNTEEARRLGHKIADEIVYALTHEHSFFASQIAVVGTRTGNKEIYVMDIDGKGVQPITANHSINLSPAWSSTGDRIAYTSYKMDNADVYVKELVTGAVSVLSGRPGVDSGAAFSPDGSRVALSRSNGSESDIYVLDARTGLSEKRVTNAKGIDVEPCWSPDGARIAYASERSGGSQIYVQDLASGDAKRVTFEGWMNNSPAWSPDGEHLAFVGRDEHFDVFVVRTDGTGLLRITQDAGDNEDPVWSADGNYLMFSSTRNGKSQIVISTADGRVQTVVTPDGGWYQPAWR